MKLKIKVLSRKLGGGGGGTTTVQNIPEEYRPYLKGTAKEAERLYKEGEFGKVVGTTKPQDIALTSGVENIGRVGESGLGRLEEQQQRLAALASNSGRDALMEGAAFTAAKTKAGMDRQTGAGGVLGSARAGIGVGAMEAELADRAAQQAFANKLQAEQGLGTSVGASGQVATGTASSLMNLGTQQRDIEQFQADAPYQAYQRYASSIFGNPSRDQAVSSGGGK